MNTRLIFQKITALVLFISMVVTAGCADASLSNSTGSDTAADTSAQSSTPSSSAQSAQDMTSSGDMQSGAGTPPGGTPPSGAGGPPPGGTPPSGAGGPPPGGTPPSGAGGPPGGGPPGSGGETQVAGTSIYSQKGGTVSKANETITASKQNESAVKITDGGSYTLTNSTVKTSGNTSSMDSSSFYGLNAAVLAESKSKITLKNCTINTTGTGANGAFAVGEGSIVDLADVKINCTASGAHGVDATKAGTLNLTNVDINTAGNGASAAIATDRGGGTIKVTGGTVTTTGTMSPGIYSTGTITVTGGKYTSTGSEAAVIEGKNSISLTDTVISGAKNWGVLIYQSFSGDAAVGTGNFNMTGGSLTALEGPLFYSTNTNAIIKLKGTKLNAASGTILSAGANRWGTSGKNGANVTLTADSQAINGNIICDSVSTISAALQNGSTLDGSINSDNKAGSMALTLDSSSTWEVTGTSYLTGLTDSDTTLANIHDNGNTVYYKTGSSTNSWLNGKTYTLHDGGKLTPIK